MNHEGNDPPKPEGGDHLDGRLGPWQRDLKRLLARLEPFLVAGRLVTFQQITSQERSFFIGLTDALAVPETACAVFIPPSVVQQAMWPAMRGEASGDSAEVSGIAPDAGAVVAVRCGSLKTMVNALFAYPPLAPGIDVYQNEQLLAGYTYNDHPECLEGLNEVMKTYLG